MERFALTKIFPVSVREALAGDDWQEGLEEIRVRVGQPLEFCYDRGNRYLIPDFKMRMTDIAEMLNYISDYSLYAYREEMRQGYITIEGGHRVGLAGGMVTEQGKLSGVHHVSFLNVRVAHEKVDCAKKLLPYLRSKNSIYNTLFLSEPGAGKTTLLRDCIRQLSMGDEDHPGIKVCVVDERSEIAACHMGVPQNDLGPRTDVMDGCGKWEGMMMLLRSMSPQVLAVDELGDEKDFQAVEQAVYSGSRVLGTVHAGSVRELGVKPCMRRLAERKLFGRYVRIERRADGMRILQIYDADMGKIG